MTLQGIELSQHHSSTPGQPSSEYVGLREARKDNRKAQSTSPGYELPYPAKRSWEVPRHHVTIDKVIGKGAFGQVAKGTAVALQGRPDTTTVAIKMLKRESCTYFRTFLTVFFCLFVLHFINICCLTLQLTLRYRTKEN